MKKIQKNVPSCLMGFNSNAAGGGSAENTPLLEGPHLSSHKKPLQLRRRMHHVFGAAKAMRIWGTCGADAVVHGTASSWHHRPEPCPGTGAQMCRDAQTQPGLGGLCPMGSQRAAAQLFLAAFCPSHSSGINHSCPTLQHSHGDSFRDGLPLAMLPAFVLLFAIPT